MYNRNYPPPAAQARTSPHAARRGPMAPAQAQPPPSQAELHRQQLEQIRRQDLARRQAKKPNDRDIPEEVSEAVVGDGVERYKKLREVEKQLDAVMMRKRLDISDNLQRRYTRREGILRIWVSNTAEGQPWQLMEEGNENEDGLFELGGESQATFRVKIEGRLLEDPEEDEEDKPPPSHRPRLSHFFKAINIDFDGDPNLRSDGYSHIEWRKPQAGANFDPNSSEVSFDTLEFTRKADDAVNITINLVRDEKNERFKLSPELADILDTEEEDRAGAVQGIWEYCRAMGLQEDDDKRKVVCDEPLRRLFKQDHVYFPYVPDLLLQHLQPLPPIQLHYTIRVDKPYITGTKDSESPDEDVDMEEIRPCRPTIYDVRVPLPNPLQYQLTRFQTSKAHIGDLQTIVRTDDELALLVQKIHQTNAKRKFYDNLAKDPTSFIKRWVSSQQRDLEVILAEATRGGGEDATNEEFRRGGTEGVWGSELARESVGLWLARNSKPVH